jgi:hypothetical protein
MAVHTAMAYALWRWLVAGWNIQAHDGSTKRTTLSVVRLEFHLVDGLLTVANAFGLVVR